MKSMENRQIGKSSWVRIGVVLTAMLWLVLVASTWNAADAAEPSDASPKQSDEFSFNWLDPEKKIYVLQNRRYVKAERMMLSASVGTGFSNPYRNVVNFDGRASFYVSESFGVEGFYMGTSNSTNNVFKALAQAAPNTLPVIREIQAQFGGLVQWIPWYAKINVFNSILYFDWYFAGGAGTSKSRLDTRTNAASDPVWVSQDLFTLYAGTGQLFHITHNLVARIDFLGGYYSAPIYGQTGDKTWFSNYNFGIGLGWKF